MALWFSWRRRLLRGLTSTSLIFCGSISFLVVSAPAQTVTATTGAVNGTVVDSTTAVMPGVHVRLAGASLIIAQTATTDATGGYRFLALPPGHYTVTFELPGFATVVREAAVNVGFTATVDAQLQPGSVSDRIIVSGAPVIDLASTAITTHFDNDRLVSLPGARDTFAVLAQTPGVAVAKMDVGGSGALTLQEYTTYGLRATTGAHRNEVEGIRVGGASGPNDNYFSDFGSFAEIAIEAAGHSAAMPAPGTMARYVSKSGGNVYRGSLYADFQDEAWQATNIDDRQIGFGLTGGPNLNVRDVNRLARFRDLHADVGGYLKKDMAWWYGAYRDTEVAQHFAWLQDTAATLGATVVTGKVTYNLSSRQKLAGYLQHQTFKQSSFFATGTSQPFQTSDALPSIVFPVSVWKTEYTGAITDALYVEARVGGYHSDAVVTSKSTAPRVADIGANIVRGGALATERKIARPQVSGSVSFAKSRWGGSHNFRLGGEYIFDRVDASVTGYGNGCNCVSTLNNSVPTQVQLLLGPNVSKNDLITAAGFVHETWRVGQRLTLSLGLRLDRYQPGLPAQEGPSGQAFAAIAPVLTFNNWGPRAGVSTDVTGDGKTVLKFNYGKFWLYPGADFTRAFNPNPNGWTRTYRWLNDANANGQWDSGEEGSLLSVSGGSASTVLDSEIVNTYVHQATVFVEREIAPDFSLRTGMVVNAKREPYGTINISRPLSAYSIPIDVVEPGPDGQPGTADDGDVTTAYGLTPEALAAAPVNATTNLPHSDSDYYTWEITATKRQGTRWSMLASLTHTWNREAALGIGPDFTPNALINASGSQVRFTTWQAKLHALFSLPNDFRVVPIVRSQAGTPFARTFVRTLNYGNATIRAEPIDANRTPTVTLVDVRTEKAFRVRNARVMGFFDVYNVFNTNAEQTVTTTSGPAWLRPTAITGPRILRIGARVEW